MTTDLHKWARLFAAFAIILGMAYSLISSIPDPHAVLAGIRADLLWPAIVLAAGAVGFGGAGFWRQRAAEHEQTVAKTPPEQVRTGS